MGFLERRINGYREVAQSKRQKPQRVAGAELADPDRYYAGEALNAEGILDDIDKAVKGHRKKNPHHEVVVDITTIEAGEGEEKVSPVARIRWRSRDQGSPTGWVRSGVNVILHDAWNGVVRIIHSVHPHNRGESHPHGVWKNFEPEANDVDVSLDVQIETAMDKASGDDPNVLRLSKGRRGGQIGPGTK